MASQRQVGFTMMELMITIALIGIISAIAVPSFLKLIERNRIKGVAEALASDLQLARTQAIKQSSSVILAPQTGTNGSWCYGASEVACDCTKNDNTQPDYCSLIRTLGSNYPKTNLESTTGNTTFDFRRGLANSGSSCVSTPNYKLKITVSSAGKVEICSDTSAPMGGYEACASNCP